MHVLAVRAAPVTWYNPVPKILRYNSGHKRTLADRCGNVDDSLFTRDLDIASAHTRDDLAALLRIIHTRADRPSLRTLEARTRYALAPLSKTVVSEMLRGTRFPRKAVMVSFLRTCGVPEEAMEPWQRCWERVAANEQDTDPRRMSDSPGRETGEAAPVEQFRESDAAGHRTAPVALGAASRADAVVTARSAKSPPVTADQRATPRGTPGPQVRRRELGAALRSLRFNAGMTIEQVAERLMCSPSKVSRMETGFRSGSMRDVRDLCDLYAVTDSAQREHLMELARESKRREWWQSYDLYLPFGTYIGLEAHASSISIFHSALVPGLLQTADYTRSILKSLLPTPSPEWIETLVTVRLRRQLLLRQDPPPQLNVVIDEAAFHRIIGNPAAMKAQLDRIIQESGRPNISMRVIPYSHGAYPAIGSSFTILEFPSPMKGVVSTEGLFGFICLEREQDFQRYADVFHETQSIAASELKSLDIISRISCELDG